jgi:hypothetical protein
MLYIHSFINVFADRFGIEKENKLVGFLFVNKNVFEFQLLVTVDVIICYTIKIIGYCYNLDNVIRYGQAYIK